MALTIEWIREAPDDNALFDLLSGEIARLLPEEVLEDRDLYHRKLASLPRGLRAMAGMHFFDVSMTLDDLAWHFGNQNDDRDLAATLNGLRELELLEVAECFEKAWRIMEPYLDRIRRNDRDGMDPTDWYRKIGVQQKIDPLDEAVRRYCEKLGKNGLLESWATYARRYPERCVISEP